MIMLIFTRLTATLVSRIDHVVGEIENHDAVIQATLNDMRQKLAQAKVHLSQVHREKERSQQKVNEQHESATRWQQRAVDCAKRDEKKAPECIGRSRFCTQKEDKFRRAQYTGAK